MTLTKTMWHEAAEEAAAEVLQGAATAASTAL
jgi:hypothetical protein